MTRLWRGRPDADRARSTLVACAAAGSLLVVSGCGAATTVERTAADVSVTSSASASPLPPADFKAVLKGTTAVLSWTPSHSTGLTGYTIYVDNGPPASVPGSVTQYRAEGLATMSHLMQVVAVAGQEQSAPVSLTVEVPATAVEGQAGSDPFARPTPSASATPSPAPPTAAPQPVPTTATPVPTPSTTSRTVTTAEACEVAVAAFHGDDAILAGVINGDNDAARTGHTLGSEIARLEQVADRTTQPMKRLITYAKVTREARLSLLIGDDLARTFDSDAFYAAGNAIKNYCATQAVPLRLIDRSQPPKPPARADFTPRSRTRRAARGVIR